MNSTPKVFALKTLHTAIWVFYVSILVYMFYLGIADKINFTFWLAVLSVILEGLIVLSFRGKCPLTLLQERYVENPEVGFDIFLPKVVAKYNMVVYSCLFALSLILGIYRIVTK